MYFNFEGKDTLAKEKNYETFIVQLSCCEPIFLITELNFQLR